MNYKFLIIGLTCLTLFVSIMAFNPSDKIKESNNNLNLDKTIFKLPPIEDNGAELNTTNDTGCCSVLIHVKSGHDIISYRRDSNYSADIIVNEMNFNGQNSIHEYKTQRGYFTHVIITEKGWIISIGGRDNFDTNKQLEKLGSDIISHGTIQKGDINKANTILKENGWGHFVIKSPDNDVGVTSYDSGNSSTIEHSNVTSSSNITKSPGVTRPSSMTKLLKMKDGNYIKVTNSPQYYGSGQFNKFSNDPTNAAVKIIGEDGYGLDRKDVITYDYNNSKVDVWASFDGGALVSGANVTPDNIRFYGNEITGKELPKVPYKKFLGEKMLKNDNPPPAIYIPLEIIVICAILGAGFVIIKLAKSRLLK